MLIPPRVTIVIPAYNAATTLAEAVESLRAQTSDAWNAIVVDDGSQDGTLQIAERLAAADRRVRVIHQANAGESAARNAGVAAATGDWLVFLDADDWLLPTYLERMTRAISANPDADVVHCGWVRVARDGQQGPAQFAPPTQDLFPELAWHNCFAIHACMVRRSLVESIGPFDVTLRTCPDWDLWQRIARTAPRFASVPEILTCYRLRPFSAATHARQLLADGFAVIARGHGSDPRVHSPDPRYAPGMPIVQAAEAKLGFVCWAAGLAIGQDQPAEQLLDLVTGERALVATELVADSLFATVPMPSGQLIDAWESLWPRAEARIDAFLVALEAHVQSPGLAAESKSLLMRKILTWAVPAFRRHASFAGSVEVNSPLPALEVNWERIAVERAEQIAEQYVWIGELEAAKAWHDDQRQTWHRRAVAAEQRLARMDIWPTSIRVGLSRILGTQKQTPESATAEHESAPATERALPAPQRPGPFAEPRMVEPVSREWGYDRGLPVDRYYIEQFLALHEQDVKGRVLEIGDNSYTRRFGTNRVTTSDVLHVVPGNQEATFVGDLTQANHIPTDTFDCIILTQTLQLIYDFPAALRTVHRTLKPGGVLLATFPGLTRTSQTEWKGSWFWRLTPASALRLFEGVFPPDGLQVISHGNVLAASAFLYGLAVEELTAAELNHQDPDYDVIVTVRAVKAATAPSERDSGIEARLRKTMSTPSIAAKALVLLYHRVGDGTLDPWELSVSSDRFDEQMGALEREMTVVRLPEIVQEVTKGATDRPASRPLVAITFDDGYADNLYRALPLLQKHRLPATVFVCTGPVEQGTEFWWDTLERLLLWPTTLPPGLDIAIQGEVCHWDLRDVAGSADLASHECSSWRAWEPPPGPRHALYVALWQRLHQLDADERARVLTALQVWAGSAADSQPRYRALEPAELGTLAEDPLIEIGAHTINHPALARLPAALQHTEIAGSRTWLETLLRRPVASFSYPFGRLVDYTPETVTVVRQVGFENACSNIGGMVRSGVDPFQLPRIQVKDWNGAEFTRQLRQWLG